MSGPFYIALWLERVVRVGALYCLAYSIAHTVPSNFLSKWEGQTNGPQGLLYQTS
jgi:hypothetical protein